MNRIVIFHLLILSLVVSAGCRNSVKEVGSLGSSQILVEQTVEASCAQCQFGMDGSGCDLAIRIGDHTYWVDGSGIDDHGDAHGDDGLCNCIRNAIVSGEIIDGRIEATSFELISEEKSDD